MKKLIYRESVPIQLNLFNKLKEKPPSNSWKQKNHWPNISNLSKQNNFMSYLTITQRLTIPLFAFFLRSLQIKEYLIFFCRRSCGLRRVKCAGKHGHNIKHSHGLLNDVFSVYLGVSQYSHYFIKAERSEGG